MKYILNILLLFALFQSSAQNLVPNPSFEDTVNCPPGPGQVPSVVGWTASGSADYFHSCYNDFGFPQWGISVPNNWGGYQEPYGGGNAYCALGTIAPCCPSVREYIGTQLATPLDIGQKYFVSLRTSLALNDSIEAQVATNNIGLNFSTVNYSSANPPPLNNAPQINHSSLITDSINWTLVSGSFIADSNYAYVWIGNFFTDSMTDTLNYGYNANRYAYYYIDAVCVSIDSLTCFGSVGIGELNNIKEKTLVKIVDIIGRETEDKPNTLLIFIYSDGTSEKVFKLER
jgi:hypothetical protein